jgi:para-nitrobenzyl esterase|tara:strand:+ start:866 stop:2380 length:1515 start_codon:yes stop_codon:yes gene_type:complete
MVTVNTGFGDLRGELLDGVSIFRGIPFAAPPVDELRWRAPKPPIPWSGVRDATRFGSPAPQLESPIQVASAYNGMWRALEDMSEDCLTLNIWSPDLSSGQLPVMVWIHGGAFNTGAGSQPMYEGSHLAKNNDVVVVTINYRLGPFGYFNHEQLDSNVGCLDQVAALQWVQNEISTFGGDPGNITIFGESAGGKSVEILLSMPVAKGLFHKAIVQSTYDPPMERSRGDQKTTELITHLDRNRELGELLTATTDQLLQAQENLYFLGLTEGDQRGVVNPVIDGTVIPAYPPSIIGAGEAADIPVMIGTTLDETRLFSLFTLIDSPETTFENLLEHLDTGISDTTDSTLSAAVSHYRDTETCGNESLSPEDIKQAIRTDMTFRQPSIRLAEAHVNSNANTYMYIFGWKSHLVPQIGACHGLEIPFIFGNFDCPIGELAGMLREPEALMSEMQTAWANFARTGTPNSTGSVEWPPYDLEDRFTIVFDETTSVVSDPYGETRLFWAHQI